MQNRLDLHVALNLCESHKHDLYHMRRKFVVLKQLCFTLAIVKVDKLDHLDKSLSELDHVTVILGLKGKIMTTDELDCCKANEPPRMVSKLLKCKNFFPLRYVK